MGRSFSGYKIDDVIEETGLSRRQIHEIGFKGLVKPQGKARGAYYTQADVNKLKAIKELLDVGISLHSILIQKGRIDKAEVIKRLSPVLDLSEGESHILDSSSKGLKSLLFNLPNDLEITISKKSLPIPGIERGSIPSQFPTRMLEDWS